MTSFTHSIYCFLIYFFSFNVKICILQARKTRRRNRKEERDLAAKQAKYERIMRANEVARKQADRDAKVRAKAAKQRAYDESSDDEDDLSDDDDYGKN